MDKIQAVGLAALLHDIMLPSAGIIKLLTHTYFHDK